jgi:WD40 repeat protein
VFSLDGQILALASSNKTVQLWDTARGVALQTLEGHIGAYMEVAFSPDGQKLVSASGDKTVQL